MTQQKSELTLEEFLPYLLNVLAARVSDGLASVYEERFGITIAEWRILAHVAKNRLVSATEITERVNMDKSKVSRAANRLADNGLIQRKVSSGDRRLMELSLTRKGQRLFDDIAPLALEYERALLAALSPDEVARFRISLDTLLAQTEP